MNHNDVNSRFCNSYPLYTAVLNYYKLEEKQAILLFGKNWLQDLTVDDDIIYWNVKSIIDRIRNNHEYRKKLFPYFESSLDFIKRIIFKNKKYRTKRSDFYNIFNWNFHDFEFDVDFDECEINKFWKIYDKFRNVSGKYQKYFDEYKKHIMMGDEHFDYLSNVNLEDEITHNENTYDENYEKYFNEELKNAFVVLDLDIGSPLNLIKKRYHDLTLKYHPDRNLSSESTRKMTEINNAMDIILNHFGQGAVV